MTTAPPDAEIGPVPSAGDSVEVAAPRRNRRVEIGLVAIAAMIPLLVGTVAALSGWKATGDNALISIRVGDVLRGRFPMSGLPTTGENFGSGIASNHPGPLQFYVLAPFQALYGIDVGLALGAAFVNAVAWGSGTWAMVRGHGLVAGAATLGIYGLVAFGLGAHLLYDPVSSNIATFASITVVLLAAAVIEGDRKLAPAFVLVASFVIQAHLTYVALGVPVVLAVLVALGHRLCTRRGEPIAPLVNAGILGSVLWAPVLWDQVAGTGNVSNVISTFGEGNTVEMGYGFAFGRFWYAIAPIPMFARRVEGLEFLAPATAVITAFGLVIVAAFVCAAWWLRRRGSALTSLAALVGVVIAASVYSASKLPSAATVKAANLRWMWTGGALVWLVVVLALCELACRRWRRIDILSAVACLAAFAVAAGMASYWLVPPRDDAVFAAVAHLRADVRDEIDGDAYLVKYDGIEALLTVGPALVADLIASGVDARVSLGPFDRAYGDHVADERLGTDTSVLVVSATEAGSPEDALAAATPAGAVVADARYSPGRGQPDVVIRVVEGDVQATCATLQELGTELGAADRDRPQAEILGEMASVGEARLGLISSLLSKRDLTDLRTLLSRLRVWQAALAADPAKDLMGVVAGDVGMVADGVDTLGRLCGNT